jgi:hypothetical protein
MEERRKALRRRILKTGKIVLGDGEIGCPEIACTVRSISEMGACLVVSTTWGIPAVFKLIMPNETPQSCKVVWRNDTNLGVHFR